MKSRSEAHNRAALVRNPTLRHTTPTTALRSLQRTLGNIGTARLARSGIIQAKLNVSHPDDEYEREADHVADQVMRMSDDHGVGTLRSGASRTIQRTCACNAMGGKPCECEQGTQTVQRSAVSSADVAAPDSVTEALESSGSPLDKPTRNFMESRFGQDFSAVRVHTGVDAAASARSINARAYTVGNNVVFGANQYQPATPIGRRLLAHELTHVVQQAGPGRTAHQASRVSTSDNTNRASATGEMPVLATQRVRLLSTPTAQRQPAPPPPPKPMTRAEEVRQSFTSPGQVEVLPNPPSLSLYNFAIDQPVLKEEHVVAINMVASLIKQFAGADLTVEVKGHADNSGEDTRNDPLSKARAVSVQKALVSAAGVPVPIGISSCGERCPVASNATVDGRSHNRRVQISFTTKKGIDIDWPNLCALFPAICLCLLNPMFCPEEEEDGDGDGINWPSLCSGPLGKAICIGVLCLLAFKLCLSAFCRMFPELCLATLCKVFPSLCKGKKKKPDEPKRKKACPIKVDLPSGDIQAYKDERVGYARLWYPFPMNIDFTDKPSGCECSCGEYNQLVRGYFAFDKTGKGPWKKDEKLLTPGVYLRENDFQEDGHIASGPYGHRYWDDEARTDPKPNIEGDRFLWTRRNGCRYRGKDEPSYDYAENYPARIKMHLEFVGGPVDVCMTPGQRVSLPSHWHSWVIDGEAQAKPPTQPKAPTGGNRAFIIRSGLPKNPKVGQDVMLDIAIEGEEPDCHGKIPVAILVVDSVFIIVMTHNSDRIQIAPDVCPNIWILPYQTVTIVR